MRKIGFSSWRVEDPAKLLEEIKGMSVETFDMWDNNTMNLIAKHSYDDGARDGAIVACTIIGTVTGLVVLGKFISKKLKDKQTKGK